jgi:hypothetical protein
MLQAFKIIRGFDTVDSSTWFQKVDVSIRTTRSAADPLNLRPQAARLETRRNFFSYRVVDAWNAVPGDIKRENSERFQKCVQKTQRDHGGERPGWLRKGEQNAARPHPEPDTS